MKTPPHYIIRRGHEYPVDFIVENWRAHDMQWVGRTRSDTRAIVSHWTAAENPPERVYANMSASKLSVHFIVDAAGLVYQMADAEMRGAHAGADHGANSWTVGIEFICPGDAPNIRPGPATRETVIDTIHGKMVQYKNLTPSQMEVGVKLNRALCQIYDLPFRVPLTSTGNVVAFEPDALTLARFKGCLGHLHLKQGKRDPGLRLLRAIHEAAEEPPPRVA